MRQLPVIPTSPQHWHPGKPAPPWYLLNIWMSHRWASSSHQHWPHCYEITWVHPWRLTWNIIMEVWKIMFLSRLVICRFHVNLLGYTLKISLLYTTIGWLSTEPYDGYLIPPYAVLFVVVNCGMYHQTNLENSRHNHRHHIISYVISYHNICHVMSYHVSYHIILYHIISYHIRSDSFNVYTYIYILH